MADRAIQETIQREFSALCEVPRGRPRERVAGRTRNRSAFRAAGNSDLDRHGNYKLQFSYLGKNFETILEASCETIWEDDLSAKQFHVKTKSVHEKRPCIDISISMPPFGVNLTPYIQKELHEFDSMISANDPENRCFNPVLAPNRTNPNESLRFSSADVLQTLKTKLQYLLPNPYDLPLIIQDAATTKSVPLTPFNVMRGEAPFYSKYGYEYRNLEALRAFLPSVTWGSLRLKSYFGPLTFHERILQITRRTYEDSTPIFSLLQGISFETESTANERFILETRPDTRKNLYNPLSLSLALLKTIAKEQGYSDEQVSAFGGEGNLFSARHNPNSPEWLAFSNRCIFKSFTPVPDGGKRKTRRKKSTKKPYKKTKSIL